MDPMYAQLFANLFKIKIEPPRIRVFKTNSEKKHFKCIQHRHTAENDKLVCNASPNANIGMFRMLNV